MRNLIYLIFILLGFGCRAPLASPAVQPRFYAITDQQDKKEAGPQVQKMVETIAPYKAQLDAKMNRQLAIVETLLKKGQPESTLGNWSADLFADAAAATYPDKTIAFATLNQGGLRVSEIRTGPLIVSEIYELMPFDNELVLMTLSGMELREFVGHIANAGGWPVSSGLSVSQDRDGLTIKIGGKAVNPTAIYYVAVSDYVAGGGSGASMLPGKTRTDSGLLIRDLLVEFAGKATEPINVKTEGNRMKINR